MFGNEVGEHVKNYQKAWSTLRLRAIDHGPHWASNGRFLPCCREQLAKMNLHMHDLRRESGEAAKWEQDLAELRKNLPQGPQKGPHADRIVRQYEAGKTGTPPRINRLGA